MRKRRTSESSTSEDVPVRRNFLGRGNDAFTCLHCGCEVLPLVSGGFRSHCPECLWSRHVDEIPGDRESPCGGLMKPVGVEKVHDTWYVVHHCRECGFQRRSRLSLEDGRQSDNWETVIAISRRLPDDDQRTSTRRTSGRR